MTIICLLTDFGERDFYVGAMKGVILKINPKATIVDITHDVEMFNILEASYTLYGSYREYPEGTVFLVVVDPGVGSNREALVVKTKKYVFVAPNNGVLSLVLEDEKVDSIYAIPPTILRKKPSHTFHGRDVFAPAAAFASLGDFSKFDPFNGTLVKLESLKCECHNRVIIGNVAHIDRFGNVATTIRYSSVKHLLPIGSRVEIYGIGMLKVVRYFSELEPGEAGILENSLGFLEIVVREGSAKERFRLNLRDHISIRIPE